MDFDLNLIEQRHEMSPEDLTAFVSANFGGNLLTLRQLEPFIIEIKRRFKNLPREKGVDGEFKMIGGHRSFKKWCHGILGRTDRTVRYMLAKSKNNENRKPVQEAETISAVFCRVSKYIIRQPLDDETKKHILKLLGQKEK